ncbi:MAG: endonuclease/exonuclease/phosphatase family protein [Anaerolineae bacterium]|nr:endonuclease/exonuclease/phosphatase family protein [Anaerolineae bacterium]
MKSDHLRIALFAVLFLFLLQLSGTLIESIYILDLLNTTLDAKALGLLFFFTPLLLLPFHARPRRLALAAALVLALARGMTPYLPTAGRLLAAGIGTGAALVLVVLLLEQADEPAARQAAGGLALAAAGSALLRTLNASLDLSLTIGGSWIGWLLSAALVWLCRQPAAPADGQPIRRGFAGGLGLMLPFTLVLFAFSAPAVIARWTGANYAVVVILNSLAALASAAAALSRPDWLRASARKGLLVGWNLLFSAALVGVLLMHRVAFPLSPDTPAVVVVPSGLLRQLPLYLALLLSPVVYLDAAISLCAPRKPARPGGFSAGVLVGTVTLVLLMFMLIFSNVWGYVEPVSPFSRNKFWLPFLLLGGGITLAALLQPRDTPAATGSPCRLAAPVSILLAVGFVLTAAFAVVDSLPPRPPVDAAALTVMTYNIQQANDDSGQKSYRRQLDLIRGINPDLLALQESDSARISLNNNDYVRYYATRLGYYSYYGPATLSGSYGTAILSRYPLENPRVLFSYSDADEIGTAVAEIMVDGQRFTVFNVHPDGSDAAMMAFARTLLQHSAGLEHVIALGDYNLRSDEAAYQAVAAVFHNVPGSEGHIDHIFLSPNLQMDNPVYLPAPQSATDHPLLYATVTWRE